MVYYKLSQLSENRVKKYTQTKDFSEKGFALNPLTAKDFF